MKLSQVKVKTISNATLATFESDLNTFLAGALEKELISIQYQWDGATYTALIIYAE